MEKDIIEELKNSPLLLKIKERGPVEIQAPEGFFEQFPLHMLETARSSRKKAFGFGFLFEFTFKQLSPALTLLILAIAFFSLRTEYAVAPVSSLYSEIETASFLSDMDESLLAEFVPEQNLVAASDSLQIELQSFTEDELLESLLTN
jgi:hypothetical protein